MTRGVKPYEGPAGGWDSLAATARALREQQALLEGSRALLHANQPGGFDCPGCAWPDPAHAASFEFCENGAKAVAWEATSKTVGPAFFAAHTVTELRARTDHWLESQGRLAHPMRYDRASDRYLPLPWDEAFAAIGERLCALGDPDTAAFYTSGRTSNEAAFLYQLFVRELGTNNLPDCSNLCHEATSIGLPQSIGVGKGTVQLADFGVTDAVFTFGHNPGTNHPRMLATLREVARRGKPIVAFNPMRERGLERFRSPMAVAEMLTGGETALATHYFQPRVGTDHLVLQALMKRLLELEAVRGGVLDHAFIEAHTTGIEALRAALAALDWAELCEATGLTRDDFDLAAGLYAAASAAIVAYGMGLTQHRHGTANVQQVANLLLLRGNLGRPGAGICPVRGHSNVQGNRTVGINERPPPEFLDRLDAAFGIRSPRKPGVTVVECIEAIRAGRIRALVSLGGNFAVAAPDPVVTHAAMGRLGLVVGIHTKLNRSHLLHGPEAEALILPCLARSDRDLQATGLQSVTVEDSMSMVHASRGFRVPVSAELRSEPAIVAGIARATLLGSRVPWQEFASDYSRIRAAIGKVVPGFEDYEERIRRPGGFHLRNPAAERKWRVPGGKARFIPCTVGADEAPAGFPLRLTTVRSHDQYNTTVYGLDDRYRGVTGRRDVVFMNEQDIAALGINDGDAVDLVAPGDGGGERRLAGLAVVPYAIARGACAAYYPEAMPLIALADHDAASFTPAYKSVWVRVERSTGPGTFLATS